ncbi:hypothetical protein HYH02_014249 [Chlamydomonas schloesseri]|uniref:Uncharacterized protein n=1 Tax=Chlamydomonas schloesseri TaxID=2026947 RepID=A0A835SPD4_9CHLO|nr:hypothetical protein HYH02_014249 [Chlamydomonas schloesseri]|eukprot:KAG2428837.1 hypothetical protein HYH02_014249 [Chlamydomonas schloesseri]
MAPLGLASSTGFGVQHNPAPAAAAAPPAPKSNIVSGALQSVFLLLLGAALALTGVKRQWDVFGVLLAAASVQLGGQLAKWLGSSSSSSGSSGSRRGAGASSRTPRGGRGSNGTGAAPAAGAGMTVVGPAGAAEGIRAHPVALRPDIRMGGVWVKDAARSDSMDAAVAAMRLNGLVRTAIRLIRGLELDPAALAAGRFDMAIFSIIAWFKVRESYQLDGTVGYFNRRDLRRGKHAASVCVQPDGSLVLSVSWGEPLAGTGTDHFVLVPAAAAATAAAAAAGEQDATGGGVVGSSAGSVSGSVVGVYGAGGGGGGGGGAGASGRGVGEGAASPGDLLVVTSSIRLAGAAAPVTYRTVYVRAGHHHHHQQQQQHSGANSFSGHGQQHKRQHPPNPRAQLT